MNSLQEYAYILYDLLGIAAPMHWLMTLVLALALQGTAERSSATRREQWVNGAI